MEPLTQTHMQPYTKFLFDYVFVQFSYVGALLSCQAIDILTGFLAAAIRGKATSSASWKGILKKIATWCALLFVVILCKEAQSMFPVPLVRPAFWAFIASEGLSITENLALCGVKMPPFVVRALYALREQRANVEKLKDLGSVITNNPPAVVKETIKETKTIVLAPSLPGDSGEPLEVKVVNKEPVPVTETPKD